MKRVSFFSRTTILTAAALLAVALAVIAPADASVIVFNNPAGPGHFDWPSAPFDEFLWLDLVLPADEQGVFSASAIGQGQSADGTAALTGDAFISLGGEGDFFVIGHPFSTEIGDSLTWGQTGIIAFPGFPDEIPVGEESYIGVRFDVGAGNQFGWIGVIRSGNELNAFAWGYETEPGVPIAAGAPEPGTLSLLALAGAALLRRRRRCGGK